MRGGWRAKQERETAKKRFVDDVRSGKHKLCVQKVLGLWMILGESDYYLEIDRPFGVHPDTIIKAYDTSRSAFIYLKPITKDEAAEIYLREVSIQLDGQFPESDYVPF